MCELEALFCQKKNPYKKMKLSSKLLLFSHYYHLRICDKISGKLYHVIVRNIRFTTNLIIKSDTKTDGSGSNVMKPQLKNTLRNEHLEVSGIYRNATSIGLAFNEMSSKRTFFRRFTRSRNVMRSSARLRTLERAFNLSSERSSFLEKNGVVSVSADFSKRSQTLTRYSWT